MTFFHLRTLLKQPHHAQVNRWPDSTVTLKLIVQTPDLPIEPPRPKDRLSWSFPIKFLVVFWPLSWREKTIAPSFFGGFQPRFETSKELRDRTSYWVPYFFQPQSYSSFEIWIKGKPQANKILFVWVMFFLFPKNLFWETNLQTASISSPRHILDPSRHSQGSGRRGSPRGRLSCRMVHVTPSTCQSYQLSIFSFHVQEIATSGRFSNMDCNCISCCRCIFWEDLWLLNVWHQRAGSVLVQRSEDHGWYPISSLFTVLNLKIIIVIACEKKPFCWTAKIQIHGHTKTPHSSWTILRMNKPTLPIELSKQNAYYHQKTWRYSPKKLYGCCLWNGKPTPRNS